LLSSVYQGLERHVLVAEACDEYLHTQHGTEPRAQG
jgi:hypothetical protein